MTPARSLLVAMVAATLLVGVRPIAGVEQFPHGLLSAELTKDHGCTIETRPLSFGTYDPLAGTALDAVGQVIYTCGNDSQAQRGVKNIRIELTTGASGAYADRRMTTGGLYLYYNIYLDATHRTIWGNGANGTDVYFDAHPPNDTPVTVPVYGQIRALQDVSAGQYTDVITARVLF